MPHRQITRVEVPAFESASRGVRVLEVSLHNDIPARYNLADSFAVLGDVHKLIAGCLGINDASRGRGSKSMSLPCGKLGPLGKRESKPRGSGVIASEWPIGLTVESFKMTAREVQMADIDERQAINVDRLKTFALQLSK